MNNDNKPVLSEAEGLIPKYRFPEFKDDGDWKNRNLGDLSNVVRGGSPRPIEDFLTNEISGLNWLKIADVSPDSKYITSTKERVIEEASSKTRIVNKGDLILSNSMSFGRPYILDITTCIHDGWIAISDIKSTEIEKDYLYYFISSDFSQKYFNIYAAGAAVKNLNAEIIKNLPIDYPNTRAEQQKIAACLSSLDDVIAGHEEKLTVLEEHKKGLMQNLFPQEGETQPKYRFPEFENDGDWVETRVSHVFSFFQGYAFSSNDAAASGTRWLKIADVSFQKMNSENPTFLPKAFKELHARFLVKKGDVVIALTRPILNGKLKISKVDDEFNDSLLNQRVAKLETSYNLDFVYYLLQLQSFIKEIENKIAGNEPPNLSYSQIQNINVLITNNPSEQQKIASVLSSVDELIVAQREKIEALKEHKKGLMQGLFPKIES